MQQPEHHKPCEGSQASLCSPEQVIPLCLSFPRLQNVLGSCSPGLSQGECYSWPWAGQRQLWHSAGTGMCFKEDLQAGESEPRRKLSLR